MTADHRWKERFFNSRQALAQLEPFSQPAIVNEPEQQGLTQTLETTFERACNALLDSGHASGLVEIQWWALQQVLPEDYAIPTVREESKRRFINLATLQLGWGPLQWEGQGAQIDPCHFCAAGTGTLTVDPMKTPARPGFSTPANWLEELATNDVQEADNEVIPQLNEYAG